MQGVGYRSRVEKGVECKVQGVGSRVKDVGVRE